MVIKIDDKTPFIQRAYQITEMIGTTFAKSILGENNEEILYRKWQFFWREIYEEANKSHNVTFMDYTKSTMEYEMLRLTISLLLIHTDYNLGVQDTKEHIIEMMEQYYKPYKEFP